MARGFTGLPTAGYPVQDASTDSGPCFYVFWPKDAETAAAEFRSTRSFAYANANCIFCCGHGCGPVSVLWTVFDNRLPDPTFAPAKGTAISEECARNLLQDLVDALRARPDPADWTAAAVP